MPFVPPVPMACSASGLQAGEVERPVGDAAAAARARRDDRGSSVKERLASNLKQLGKKKSQPKSHLPTAKGGSELHAKRKDRLLPSAPADETLSKTGQQQRSAPAVRTRARHPEEAHFTLTLAPEAVLLLQRRNGERHQHPAPRNGGGGGGVPAGSASDSRNRRRDTVPKRHQAATQRPSAPGGRALPKAGDGELRDVSSIVKISLLNEQHKYDDVEEEEEEEGGYGVDERVALKCTEWLRGLEGKPVTVGNGPPPLSSF